MQLDNFMLLFFLQIDWYLFTYPVHHNKNAQDFQLGKGTKVVFLSLYNVQKNIITPLSVFSKPIFNLQ